MDEQHRKNISIGRRGIGTGDSNPMKRPEVRAKVSASLKGRRQSEELKKRLGISRRGPRPHTSGINHPRWKGGGIARKLKEIIRQLYQYRQWRSDVFTRDNFTCQKCLIRGVKLEADHIKPYALIVRENSISSVEEALNCEELWDINNGRTLCNPCHRKTETWGNRKASA